MVSSDVRQVLIDQGRSYDIMYARLLDVPQLTYEFFIPCMESDLQGFHTSTSNSWGYM